MALAAAEGRAKQDALRRARVLRSVLVVTAVIAVLAAVCAGWAIAFRPDTTRIASGSADSTSQLWDAVKKTQIGTLVGRRGRSHQCGVQPRWHPHRLGQSGQHDSGKM